MLQPLEQVRDHQNPLAHTPALASCQAPQLRRPRFAAKEVYRHCPSPKTWYTRLTALPYLGITGNRYKYDFRPLPYLVFLGAVGAAIVGVFFGVGFLLLVPSYPVNPPADPIPPAQTPEAHELAPPA